MPQGAIMNLCGISSVRIRVYTSNVLAMKKSRRNFLGKMGLGLVGALGLGHAIHANNKATETEPSNNDAETMATTSKDPILQIKPLGFQWETADPFLFCVHHDDKFPVGQSNMGPDPSLLKGRRIGQDFLLKDGWRMYHGETIPGFPGHPHRGFETITVVRKGMVDHADFLGGAGRYGDGDVQWMTAGKGIQHSEMFPLLHQDKENPMELFQIWINLPQKNKMVDAHYKMLWNEQIPKITQKDAAGNAILIEVIAGVLEQRKAPSPPPNSWANDANNEVAVWNLHLAPNATWTLPAASAGLNRVFYYYEGEGLELAETSIPTYHSIQLHSDEPVELKAGASGAKLLLLQGKPMNEPVVQHGPFVMNTRQEIQQAFADYQQTRFGGWPWQRIDQVHDRSKGRFAKHGDGREELPTG